MIEPSPYSQYLDSEIDPAFAARARFVFEAVLDLKPKMVLDCGCGRGFYAAVLGRVSPSLSVIGIDRSLTYLFKAKTLLNNGAGVAKASLPSLPFPDESFDCVICSEVLEHVEDDLAAITEIARIISPGGSLIVTVPHDGYHFFWDPLNFILRPFGVHLPSKVHWLSGIWADHSRLYSEESLRGLLGKEFDITSFEGVIQHSWPFSHFLLYGIGKNLVEAFGLNSLDRFSLGGEKRFSKLCSMIMRLPSRLDTGGIKGCVNLVAVGRKKAI